MLLNKDARHSARECLIIEVFNLPDKSQCVSQYQDTGHVVALFPNLASYHLKSPTLAWFTKKLTKAPPHQGIQFLLYGYCYVIKQHASFPALSRAVTM